MYVGKFFVKPGGRRKQSLLVVGFVLQSFLAAAQSNFTTNPGFETGNTSGWFAFGPPSIAVETIDVHTGTFGCLVPNRTATWNGIAQSVEGDLQAGQTYDGSASVTLASSGSQTVQLTVQKTDGGGTSYSPIASGLVSSSAWTQLFRQYTYNPSGAVTVLNFYVEVPSSSNAAFYIDDVEFNGGSVVTNLPTNAVS